MCACDSLISILSKPYKRLHKPPWRAKNTGLDRTHSIPARDRISLPQIDHLTITITERSVVFLLFTLQFNCKRQKNNNGKTTLNVNSMRFLILYWRTVLFTSVHVTLCLLINIESLTTSIILIRKYLINI